MRKYLLILVGIVLAAAGAQSDLSAQPQGSQKKLAQTGFQFLSVSSEARAAAMGEAFTTIAGNSSSIFYNPANMARMNSFADIALSQNQWIADITYNAGSVALRPFDGAYGVFAVGVVTVDYGEFIWTMVDPTTDKGFIDDKNSDGQFDTFSPSAYAIGVGYAKALTDRFCVGGQVKYVTESLGSSVLPALDDKNQVTSKFEVQNKLDVLAFDFGTNYQTGFKSLIFGMTVRNFSKEVKFQREGFQLPLTFKIGVSINMLDLFMENNKNHSFLVSVDAIHPRDYSEQLNIGGEYVFMNMLALRAGYNYNYDERDIAAGFGVQKTFGTHSLAIDYAYTPFGVFDNVNRFSFRLSL